MAGSGSGGCKQARRASNLEGRRTIRWIGSATTPGTVAAGLWQVACRCSTGATMPVTLWQDRAAGAAQPPLDDPDRGQGGAPGRLGSAGAVGGGGGQASGRRSRIRHVRRRIAVRRACSVRPQPAARSPRKPYRKARQPATTPPSSPAHAGGSPLQTLSSSPPGHCGARLSHGQDRQGLSRPDAPPGCARNRGRRYPARPR